MPSSTICEAVRAIDLPGVALVAAVVTVLFLVLGDAEHPPVPLIASGVVAFAVVVWSERHAGATPGSTG